MKRLSVWVLAFCLLAGSAYAHPGGTDSSGGHYNRSTGEYHYHHGYPEHDHPGGICPYKAKPTSTPRKSSSSSYSYTARATPRPTSSKRVSATGKGDNLVPWWIVAILGGWAAYLCVKNSKNAKELSQTERARSKQEESLHALEKQNTSLEKQNASLENQCSSLEKQNASLGIELAEAKGQTAGLESMLKQLLTSNSLKALSGMPKDTEIGEDGMPRVIGSAENWGDRYTRYVSSWSSTVYHQKGCRNASIPVHIFDPDLPGRHAACCASAISEKMDWFADYIQLKSYCDSKDITPLPDNVIHFPTGKKHDV